MKPSGVRATAVAAVLAGVLAAGCGGQAAQTAAATSPSPNTSDQMLAYVRCMRSHGVQMPDPGSDSSYPKPPGGYPALVAAEQACRKYAPAKIAAANGAAASDRLLAVARCLRAHGLNVPDPQPGQQLQLPSGTSRSQHDQAILTSCFKGAAK